MPKQSAIGKIFLVFVIGIIGITLLYPSISIAQNTPETVKADKSETAVGISCSWYEIFCHLSRWFSWILETIGYLISYIAVLFITLAASFIQILITMSRDLLSNIFITTGFGIVLNIANLGFVLAIIIIAFSTMLRFQTYGAKQLLWKLIVAAVLVNFSLTIAGVIIDLTNVISFYFLEGSSPDNIAKFGENLANSLNLEKLGLLNISETFSADNITLGMGKGLLVMLMSIASLFSTAIFSVFLAIVFWGTALMVLIRNLYLAILLILMPIAWLFWIFPNLSHLWSKWWSNFIRWTFFLPAAMFFIYLSTFSAQHIGEIVGKSQNLSSVQAASSLTNFKAGGITTLLQIVLQIGILVGGLIAANSMSITGAGVASKAASGVKGWVIGKVGKIGKAAGKAASAPAKGVAERIGTGIVKSKLWNKAAGTVAKVPGLKGMAAEMYNLAEAPKGTVEESQKQFTKDSNEAVLAKSSAFTRSPIEQAARANEIVKRGLIEKYITQQGGGEKGKKAFDDLLKAAKVTGSTKEILSNRADFAPQLTLSETDLKDPVKVANSIEQVAGKLSAEGILKQAPEVFKNTDFISALDTRHYSEVFQKASKEQQNYFATGLQKMPKKFVQKIAENLSAPAILNLSNEVFKNANFVNALDARRFSEVFKNGSTAQLKNLSIGLEKIREQNPTDERVQMAIQNPIMQSVIKKSLEEIKEALNKDFVGLFNDVVKKEMQEKAEATKVAEKGKRATIRKIGTLSERIQLEELEEKERKERT